MNIIGAMADNSPGSLGALVGEVGIMFPSAVSSHHWKGRWAMRHKKPDRRDQLSTSDNLPGEKEKIQPLKTEKPINLSATVD